MRAAAMWLGVVVVVAGCGGRSEQQARALAAAGTAGTAGTAGATADPTPSGGSHEVAPTCDPATCSSGCQDGRCVEVLASDLHSPTALAAGRTDLFWTTTLGVMRVSKTGGAPSVLVPTSDGAGAAIAVDDTYVYWSGKYGSQLVRAAIADPTPEVLVDIQLSAEVHTSGDISAIVLDDSAIYWTDWQNGTVSTLSKSGGAPRVLTSAAHRPSALAVDATNAYWTEGVENVGGAVVSMPLAGGTPLTLVAGQDAPGGIGGIAINTTHVYWTTISEETLRRVPLGGGAIELISKAEVYPARVVLDEKFAYWVGGYAVQKVSLLGGTHEQEPGDDFVNDVAVDATSVYFIQDGEGGSFINGSLVKVTPK